jgi:hypothetical protein
MVVPPLTMEIKQGIYFVSTVPHNVLEDAKGFRLADTQ